LIGLTRHASEVFDETSVHAAVAGAVEYRVCSLDDTAVVRRKDKAYEIEIGASTFYAIGPCSIHPGFGRTTYSLYVEKPAGDIPGNQVSQILPEGRPPKSEMRGHLVFSPDGKKLQVHLRTALYGDNSHAPTREGPYDANGTYKVKRR
jgi:hypothetical protein